MMQFISIFVINKKIILSIYSFNLLIIVCKNYLLLEIFLNFLYIV